MILTKKQARKLGFSETIDLKEMQAREYLASKETTMSKTSKIILKYIGFAGVIWFIIVTLVGWGIVSPEANAHHDLSIKSKIRLERLEACEKEYKKSNINKQFIHGQVPASRCATYMTLVYAYESNYGTSRMCREDKNCFWIKGNGVDTPRGFLKFSSEKEGREYFARKYWQWHYKKNIETFVYNWSMTDRETYIDFMRSKYWKVYSDIEYLYMTGREK